MSNVVGVIGGLILIGLAFIIFTGSIGSLNTATQTGPGTTLENGSAGLKAGVSVVNQSIPFFPVLMFFGGFAIVLKSIL